jgi:hypothetical protein
MTTAMGNIIPVGANGIPQALNNQVYIDPNTALLQQLVNRLCPTQLRQTAVFSGNSADLNAVYYANLNGQQVNGFINSLTTGTVYLYFNQQLIPDFTNPPPPDVVFSSGGNGSDQIHLPTFDCNTLTFFNFTASSGKIHIISY